MKSIIGVILVHQLLVIQCFPSTMLTLHEKTNVATPETLNLPLGEVKPQLHGPINAVAAKPVAKSQYGDTLVKILPNADSRDHNGVLIRKLQSSSKSFRVGEHGGILQWVQGLQPLPFAIPNQQQVPFANYAFVQDEEGAKIQPAWQTFFRSPSDQPLPIKAVSPFGENATKIWGEGTEYKFPYIVELLVQNVQKYYSNYVYNDSSRPQFNRPDRFDDSADFAPLPTKTTATPLLNVLPELPQTTKFIQPVIIPNSEPLVGVISSNIEPVIIPNAQPLVEVLPSIEPPYILVGDDDDE